MTLRVSEDHHKESASHSVWRQSLCIRLVARIEAVDSRKLQKPELAPLPPQGIMRVCLRLPALLWRLLCIVDSFFLTVWSVEEQLSVS